jgi:hypothetical protein
MCVCVSLCCVVLCVGRGLGTGLIRCPRSPTKCLKGSISKKKYSTPGKGLRNNEEEEEEEEEEEVIQGEAVFNSSTLTAVRHPFFSHR